MIKSILYFGNLACLKIKNEQLSISLKNCEENKQAPIEYITRLKDYVVKEYVINQKRLDELPQPVQLNQKSIGEVANLTEVRRFRKTASQYTQSFVLLNQYEFFQKRIDDKTYYLIHQ